MATKNAKLMEKKITKPTISKPSNTVVRKADKPRNVLKKSLWNVASNKWMKKADGKETYKNAVRMLQNAKNVAAEKAWNFYRSSWVWADAYIGMKRADKEVEKLEKKVASLRKYNKWSRVHRGKF